MKKTLLFFLVSTSGCAGILPAVKAYQVTPELPEGKYTAILAPLSPTLSLEQGTSWEVILQWPNREEEIRMATLMAFQDSKTQKLSYLMGEEKRGYLLILLPYPKSKIISSRIVIRSHDRTRCADLNGRDLGWCEDHDLWFRAPILRQYQEGRISGVSPQSPEDKEIQKWFHLSKRNPMSHENFAFSREEYSHLQKRESKTWRWIVHGLQTALSFTVVSLVATPVAGAITLGINGASGSIGILAAPESLDYPEYLSWALRQQTPLLEKRVAEEVQRQLSPLLHVSTP